VLPWPLTENPPHFPGPRRVGRTSPRSPWLMIFSALIDVKGIGEVTQGAGVNAIIMKLYCALGA